MISRHKAEQSSRGASCKAAGPGAVGRLSFMRQETMGAPHLVAVMAGGYKDGFKQGIKPFLLAPQNYSLGVMETLQCVAHKINVSRMIRTVDGLRAVCITSR